MVLSSLWVDLIEASCAFAAGAVAEYVAVAVALIPYRRLPVATHWSERARCAWSARLLIEIGPTVLLFVCAFIAGLFGSGEYFGLTGVPLFIGAILGTLPGLRQLTGRKATLVSALVNCGTRFAVLSPATLVFLAMLILLSGRMLDATSGAIMMIGFVLAITLTLGGAVSVARWLCLFTAAPARVLEMVRVASGWVNIEPPRSYTLRWDRANAVAYPFARTLAFTSALLDLLTDDELLGVAAHEIAHLEESRMQKLTRLSGIFMLFPLFSYPVWFNTYGTSAIFISLALALICGRVLRTFSQKMERRADAAAQSQGTAGDSEAFARALEKLYAFNLVPAVLRGKRQTHPHLYDRLLAAGVQPGYPRPQPPSMMLEIAIFALFTMIMGGILIVRNEVLLPFLTANW
jgi:Zn-dependent protease with chaperone function